MVYNLYEELANFYMIPPNLNGLYPDKNISYQVNFVQNYFDRRLNTFGISLNCMTHEYEIQDYRHHGSNALYKVDYSSRFDSIFITPREGEQNLHNKDRIYFCWNLQDGEITAFIFSNDGKLCYEQFSFRKQDNEKLLISNFYGPNAVSFLFAKEILQPGIVCMPEEYKEFLVKAQKLLLPDFYISSKIKTDGRKIINFDQYISDFHQNYTQTLNRNLELGISIVDYEMHEIVTQHFKSLAELDLYRNLDEIVASNKLSSYVKKKVLVPKTQQIGNLEEKS